MFCGIDIDNGGQRRAELLAPHREYQARRTNLVGGPLLGDPPLGEKATSCGTLIIFHADDLAAAQQMAEADPFVTGGLFATWWVREFDPVVWP